MLLCPPDLARSKAATATIEQTGRDALSQLRLVLGVLRSSTGLPTPTGFAAVGTGPVALPGGATSMPEQVLT